MSPHDYERSCSLEDDHLDACQEDFDLDISTGDSHRKKRRRTSFSVSDASEAHDEFFGGSPVTALRGSRLLSHVENDNLSFPRSEYEGWVPPIPVTREAEALTELLFGDKLDSKDDFIEITLTDFTIYRPKLSPSTGSLDFENRSFDLEMESLQYLRVKNGVNEFLFDGMLCRGSERRFVKGVRFSTRSIGGYGDPEAHSVSDKIWIQSHQAQARGVWFRLANPSAEYVIYHKAFIWIANFAKHFVDYLDTNDDVTLEHFRADFYAWAESLHGDDSSFQRWASEYGRRDFRIAVNANVDFLFNESVNVNSDFDDEFIWKECLPERLSAIKPTPAKISIYGNKTITTPFAYSCFSNTYFKDFMQAYHPTSEVYEAKIRRMQQLGFARDSEVYSQDTPKMEGCSRDTQIKVGDVVGTPSDGGPSWKRTTELWFGYVQGTRVHRGERMLDVIWLYHSTDILDDGNYPIPYELFFSTDCNCKQANFKASEAVCKVKVDWFASRVQSNNFIVRQKFDTNNEAFVTLQRSDFTCECKKTKNDRLPWDIVRACYRVGDTVLVSLETDQLEPMIITSFSDAKKRVSLRHLQRRANLIGHKRACPIRPNEVVGTDTIFEASATDIVRACHVRHYTTYQIETKGVPTPYDRDGCGDCFYIASDDPTHPLPTFTPGMQFLYEEGLPGLSLFCGGGSFDRGLEEGGAINTKVAIDMDGPALHSYRANLAFEGQTTLFLGSVDTYLKMALDGSEKVAAIGAICFMCGGSPCVAFSLAQQNKQSARSRKNASLVASVLSYIDLYRPRYGVLENVVPMAHKIKGNDGSNVFAQLFFSIVALGYQVQCYILDAWSCGNSQKRSRLFITFASPGLTLPKIPDLTHSHPAKVNASKLGQYATGQAFCERRFEKTPFKFITVQQATQHLPDIGNARVGYCVPSPDHRIVRNYNHAYRSQIALIPVMPHQCNLAKAIAGGHMPLPQVLNLSRYGHNRQAQMSKAWGRCHPDKLFSTVTTAMQPEDAFGGSSLHFNQHRPLTIEESKIAQGIPDDEIIIGRPATQRKIAGNGVSRAVALAIGLTFRAAYIANGPGFPKTLPVPANKIVISQSQSIRHTSTYQSNNDLQTLDERVEISTRTVIEQIPRADAHSMHADGDPTGGAQVTAASRSSDSTLSTQSRPPRRTLAYIDLSQGRERKASGRASIPGTTKS